MAIELPGDDEFNAWLDDVPDNGEIDFEPVLPPSLQAEHDQLLAEARAGMPQRDPDLKKLEDRIGAVELRRMFNPDLPPYMFDRFEAIATMHGGMGLVIKARDAQLDRLVAIKLWMRSGPQAQQDLISEAKTLAKLRHANVVMVHELGVWNERMYFVMEWIDGVDGDNWMERPRSWREVRRVFVAAGTGLAAAHDAGIHHRDFKPSNILIGRDGRVVVADFGLAASLHTSPERERTGGRSGTPVYMAPERLRGKRGDARSDQFSFCVAMWRALFQERPFVGRTGGELSAAIERGEIKETAGADVPRWLIEVVCKGLAYDPEERHRDMRALIAALLDEPPGQAVVSRTGGELSAAIERGEIKETAGADVPQWLIEVVRKGLAYDPEERHRDMHALNAAPLDKPPDQAVVDNDGGNDGAATVDGRNESAGPTAQRERWPYVAMGFLSALVAVLGLNAATQTAHSAAPATAVEVEPYHVILGVIAADEFTEVIRIRLKHESEISDAQSIQIADVCLRRSKELASVDRAKADEAAFAALKVANELHRYGETAEAREAGGRLATEARARLGVGHPLGGVN